MMWHTTLGSILLLAVTCIMAGRAVTIGEFYITEMDWTYDGTTTTTLKVCRADIFMDKKTVDLLVSSPPPTGQEQFSGDLDDTDKNCAVFTWNTDFLPSSTERKYELIVETNAGALERGSVTYSMTYTVSQLSCHLTGYVRLSLATGHLTDTTCTVGSLSDTPHSICYVPKEDPVTPVTMCADQVGSSPAITVCMTLPTSDPFTPTPNTVKVKALSYTNKILTTTDPAVSEMLIRINPGTPTDFTLEFCENAVCPVPDSFSVGEAKYDLCFVNSDGNGITGVAEDEFQDLSLVTVASDTSVDFRIKNLGPQRKYLIYQTTDADDIVDTTSQPAINLDCSNIDATSYCYGFYEPADGQPVPPYIAVSFDDASNTIISLDATPTVQVEQKS